MNEEMMWTSIKVDSREILFWFNDFLITLFINFSFGPSLSSGYLAHLTNRESASHTEYVFASPRFGWFDRLIHSRHQEGIYNTCLSRSCVSLK